MNTFLHVLNISSCKDSYEEINKYYKVYRYIGGYPIVIVEYLNTKDIKRINERLNYIFEIFCKESYRYLSNVEDRLIFHKIVKAIVITLAKEKKGLDELSFSKELTKITTNNSTSNVTQKEI